MSKANLTLSSMTGYGRSEGSYDDWSWAWEVRAVNGKSLDMRLRLPPGFESLDPKVRKQVTNALGRGNLQINLTINSVSGADNFTVNENWLKSLIETGQKFSESGKVGRPRLDGLYLVKGVIVDAMPSAADPALNDRNQAILDSLDEMLSSLKTARLEEGCALAELLDTFVEKFSTLATKARSCAGAQADEIKSRLNIKINALLADNIPEERLATEAALLAVKADVSEELDRLDAHIEQAKLLIRSKVPVGRKLDFLSQEFIREINTMCSKSTDIELTQIGLEMKSLIEQFREQAANVE
jgi:uncharacterized protein (TIGR00255 family)